MIQESQRSRLLYGCLMFLTTLVGCAATAPESVRILSSHSSHVAAANRLQKEGNLTGALAALDKAVREDPRDAAAWNWRGDVHLEKRLYEKAIDDYSRSLAIQETWSSLEGRGRAELEVGQLDEALADFSKGIALGARYLYFDRGQVLLKKSKYSEAVTDFTEVITIPTYAKRATAYRERGRALVELQKYSEALADFDQGNTARSSDGSALLSQGRAFIKMSQLDRARENGRRLLELNPHLATLFGGDRMLDLFDREKRRTMTQQALTAGETAEQEGRWRDAFQQYLLANTWADNQDYSKLRTALMEKISRTYVKLPSKPDLPETARRFAVQAGNAAQEKRLGDAIALYGNASSIAPWWPEGHFNLALLLAEEGHYREAIAEMTQFLTLSPNAPDARAAQDKIYEWEGKAK